jgi:hypothetical protein
MKIKKKITAVAAAFIAATNFNGCAYGPPPEHYDSLDPENGIAVSVESSDVQDSRTEEDTDAVTEEFDPADNVNEDVYGPPVEDFDNDEPEPEPEEDFDPSKNENAHVYGPPPWGTDE